VALLCDIPWEEGLWWSWCHSKKPAAKASLQQPYNDQIMMLHELFEWPESSIHNLNFDFMTENAYKQVEEGLSSS
jgi:hypothetical protein